MRREDGGSERSQYKEDGCSEEEEEDGGSEEEEAASVFLQDCSSGPAATRLATIQIADSGAWPDAGGSLVSAEQCFLACREQFTLTDYRAVWLLLVQLGTHILGRMCG